MKQERLGAYFHIPFCDTKCVYCDFYSITNNSQSDRFYKAIEKEIHLFFDSYKPNKTVTSVFFGGGTPSLAQPDDLGRLIKTLETYCSTASDSENTLEANPGTLTSEKLTGLLDAGFNRISMGVQSFFEDDLKFLARIHSAETAKNAVWDASKQGFKNISIDLIFGLPDQTKERWKRNLEDAVRLPISHISCYNLIVEEQTPLFGYVETGKVKVLGDEANEELYEFTIEFLKREGFVQYEVSNFARPGFESLHNSTYWSFDNYFAFGPSAHGFIDGRRFQNIKSLTTYLDKLDKNELPVVSTEIISEEKLINEKLMLSVRTMEGVAVSDIWSLLDSGRKEKLSAGLNKLQSDGMIRWTENRIQPTEQGIRFADSLAEQLFI